MSTFATRSAAVLALLLSSTAAYAGSGGGAAATGNVVFFHPDGAAVNHWTAARIHTVGPDGQLHWDRLPGIGVYTGHMADRLTGSSHGGATVHAYGIKVAVDSFGMNDETPIATPSLGREALDAGRALALVNTGDITEPGTAVFVASVPNRGDREEIARQVIESGAQIILSGGETWLLPEGTTGRHGAGSRTDGVNLIARAEELGFTVVYTREELLALDPATVGQVLGVFAHSHTFNDQDFEINAIQGLPTFVETAPTIAEMAAFALAAVADDPEGFFAVIEEEGTDNIANSMNAAGTLEALARADEAIGVIRSFVDGRTDTLMLVTADSDAGGLQVFSGRGVAHGRHLPAAMAGGGVPLGQEGRLGRSFLSAPDANGMRHPFAIAFVDYDDMAGGILVRAAGLNADQVRPLMDNTDIHRLMRATMFGPAAQ